MLTEIRRWPGAYWKWNPARNRRSVAETAMNRVRQLFGGHLTLRNQDSQIVKLIEYGQLFHPYQYRGN